MVASPDGVKSTSLGRCPWARRAAGPLALLVSQPRPLPYPVAKPPQSIVAHIKLSPRDGRYWDVKVNPLKDRGDMDAQINIVEFDASQHRGQVEELWREVFAYGDPRNAPALVIAKKCAVRDGLFFVATAGDVVVGTVMAGYDGHRGWIYSMAVRPGHRHRDIGSRLLSLAEQKLAALGCVKINLQVLRGNEVAQRFYEANGYAVEDRVSMGKELSENIGF
jgi:ribosomal protein S18 acetylase RimI-like enzyme